MARAQNPQPSFGGLEELLPGLHATGTVPLPFMDDVDLRSYVLATEGCPTIVYNTPGIDAAASEIRALGEPARLLVNHYHETMFGAPELEVPVLTHEREKAATEPKLPVAETFSGPTEIAPGLETIPSFSHTPGTALYLWDQGEHRFLFTGDAIWVQDGVWTAVGLGESDIDAFLATLETLRELDFDVLVPWPAQRGQQPYDVVTPEQKTKQLGALAERLRAGNFSGPNVRPRRTVETAADPGDAGSAEARRRR